MKTNFKIRLLLLACCLAMFNLVAVAQEAPKLADPIKYVSYKGGFDIGAQGIKLSVIGFYFKNNKLKQKLVYDRQESVGLIKGMETNNGKLRTVDIQDAVAYIQEMMEDAKTTFKLSDKDFIVYVSSGVSIAPNAGDIELQTRKILNMSATTVTPKQEAMFGAKASLDRDDFDTGMLIDVGGGSSKGGFLQKYVGADNKERYTFKSFSIEYGARRLSERVMKRSPKPEDYLVDLRKTVDDTLAVLMRSSFGDNPGIRSANRNIIYMTGGSAYQFITWLAPEKVQDEIVEFNYDDLNNFYYMLQTTTGWAAFEERKFDYITDATLKNLIMKDHEKATKKVYNREACLAGISLIMGLLKEVGNVDKKTYYFSRDAYWINSVVYDTFKGEMKNDTKK
jgi:hypothetical protein